MKCQEWRDEPEVRGPRRLLLPEKKHKCAANGGATWRGSSGKGLARALDLIFSPPAAPGCVLLTELLLTSIKAAFIRIGKSM